MVGILRARLVVCFGGAILVAAALAGCNEKTVVPARTDTAPPLLNLSGGPNSARRTIPRDEADPAAVSQIKLAAQTTDASPQLNPPDDEAQAIYTRLEELLKARDAGKTVDLQPVADQLALALITKFDVNLFQLAQDAARVFEMIGANSQARLMYTSILKGAASVEQSQLTFVAKETATAGLKRLNLIGTAPSIQGTVFGGEKFNWAKYKGKVVLIDFWATWCGPCLHELPNVKKAYEKYHDQGFEVIGISLDDDKDALTEFLEKEKLPWKTLFDDDPAKHGFEGVKLAQEFGIDAIPATFLVDQQGKIVSISARGDQLSSKLQKLLSDKKDTADKKN